MAPFAWCFWLACHITRDDALPPSDINRPPTSTGAWSSSAGNVQDFVSRHRGASAVICHTCCSGFQMGGTPGADSDLRWDNYSTVHTLLKRLVSSSLGTVFLLPGPALPNANGEYQAGTSQSRISRSGEPASGMCIMGIYPALNRLETQLYGRCHVTYFAEQCRDASVRQSTASGMFVCVHHNLLLNWNNQIARWCALQGPAAVGGFQPQVSALTQSVDGREHSIIGSMSCFCVLQSPVVMPLQGPAAVGGFQPQVRALTQSINGQEHSIICPMSCRVFVVFRVLS